MNILEARLSGTGYRLVLWLLLHVGPDGLIEGAWWHQAAVDLQVSLVSLRRARRELEVRRLLQSETRRRQRLNRRAFERKDARADKAAAASC